MQLQLKSLFRNNVGLDCAASCAFIKFNRWAEAEAAIEAIHSKVTLGTSLAPLVVKFADGKVKRNDPTGVGLKRGNDEGNWPGNKRLNVGVVSSPSQLTCAALS